MAAGSGHGKSASTLVNEALQLVIECGICTNVRELRELPCQHMMCAVCLGEYIHTFYIAQAAAFMFRLEV